MIAVRPRLWLGVVAITFAVTAATAQTDGSLKWTYHTQGVIYSSPAVGSDGTVYVGSESQRLFAVNPSGTAKWIFPAGLMVSTDWFDGSPAIAPDGTIFVGNFDGRMFALNPNGTVKWEQLFAGFIASSVALAADGTLYFGGGDGALHALNPNTGVELWSYPTGDWVDSSPAVGPDGTIYFGSWDQRVYALNPTGTLKWSVLTGGAVQSSPAIGVDGKIYIGSADKKLWAIRPDGTVAWTYLTGDSVDGHPVVGADDTIYFGSADGKFYALQADGAEAWAQPYNVKQGVFGGALVRADGSVIFGASDRKVYCLNADGSLKWTYATGDVVDSSPALGPDGTIYIGSADNKIHALHGNGVGLNPGPWPKFRRDRLNHGRLPSSMGMTAPTVTTDPLSQTVAFGDAVTFSVAVTGTQPFSYQWQKDGADISGATSPAFIIDQASTADAGTYRVLVTNANGSDLSAGAVLTVNAAIAPTIVTAPRSLTLVPGNRLSLWVNATGSPPLSYQWSKNGIAVAGATSSYYEVDASTTGDAGSYTATVTNVAGAQTSAAATVSFDASGSAQLINLSARALVGTGSSILIPGFVINGNASRRLLIRAVGPTLTASPYNVPGVLPDPMLTIYSGQTPIWTNDNWTAAANAIDIDATGDSLSAFQLDPTKTDAAALIDLAPGLYTVQVSGVGGTTGVSLVELYDAGAVTAGTSKLINLSARADALTGADILIAGFSISGSVAKTVLVRAVGPTLSSPPYNVPGVLADPTLRVFQSTTEIVANLDWPNAPDVDALIAASEAVSAFALEGGSADAALLLVLMPGPYTAQATGFNGTTGNVLIEVYEFQ